MLRLYDRRAMAARSPGRFLAPIALAATITATYLVVHPVLTKKTADRPPVALTSTQAAHHAPPPSSPSTYTVKAGDTLSNISAKTRVPLPMLETLNPNINPNALQTGQRLRLRR